MLNLATCLEDSARKCPERVAMILGPHELTYAQVDAGANQVANLLVTNGIAPGDRVALSMPNLPQFAMAYYGILKTGATVVPLNVLFKGREVAYHLEDSGANAYLCFEGTPDLPIAENGRAGFDQVGLCQHFVQIPAAGLGEEITIQPSTFSSVVTSEADTAVILYTSGTTGRPKGAELTHANLTMNALMCNRLFGFTPDHPERHLVALPLFHSFGSTVQLNSGFSVGATLVLLPRFDAQQALEIFASQSITTFAGVPTMYWALLNALPAGAVPSAITETLRTAISGGSSLPVEIITQFKERFGLDILEGYGLSETSPVASFNHRDRPTKPGSIGTPIWGVEMKLVDEMGQEIPLDEDAVGEIAIRGYNIMKGYLGNPSATAEVMSDGWFRSGDLGRRDADGYYYIVDRAKDMILRGAYNVYPREIEEVLMTHPGVSLAAVIGVPDEENGEEIKAFLIPKDGTTLDPDEIIAWARENMAGYKHPRLVEVVDELPMTATGKILKRELS